MDEEILTGLRNSIEHGESLPEAIQIMTNSGYGAKEVQEAAKSLGGGILDFHQPNTDEQFVYPEKKSFFKNSLFQKKPISSNNQIPTSPSSQAPSPMMSSASAPIVKGQFSKELGNIKPHENYVKEIFLVILLLVLVGILIATITFKDALLGWFS